MTFIVHEGVCGGENFLKNYEDVEKVLVKVIEDKNEMVAFAKNSLYLPLVKIFKANSVPMYSGRQFLLRNKNFSMAGYNPISCILILLYCIHLLSYS